MKALIFGIGGQDGSYLSEFLLEKGYLVYGMERRIALEDQDDRHKRLKVPVVILDGDINNYGDVFNVINEVKPDEIYHLAAQSDVALSFKDPFQTFQTNVMGTCNVLEAMRILVPNAKMYFAGSSEMFGGAVETPQNENTKFNPRSPYGVSKCTGFYLSKVYRESYNLFICNGILFNHESPRRGKEFVTKKITETLKKIIEGKENKLRLGNIEAKRDWGYAKDYVEAMWLMLQQDKADDYVIATNEIHTIRQFVNEACKYVNIDEDEILELDPNMIRPNEINILQGDYSKAKEILKWEPKVKFKELVRLMMKNEPS